MARKFNAVWRKIRQKMSVLFSCPRYLNKNEAEKGFPRQKAGRLTTLRVSSEAENGEPQLHNKRGIL